MAPDLTAGQRRLLHALLCRELRVAYASAFAAGANPAALAEVIDERRRALGSSDRETTLVAEDGEDGDHDPLHVGGVGQ
jgi:hypothetical protein